MSLTLLLRYYPVSTNTKKKSYKKNILILKLSLAAQSPFSLIRACFNNSFCKPSYKPIILFSQICPLGLAALCVKKMDCLFAPN
jgi:hypothetical protein